MSRAAIFLAAGFEEIEALTVVDILRRAKITIDMVSVTGEQEVTGSHQITVKTDKRLEEVDFDETEILILPGGMPGTTNLEACVPLMDRVDEFYRKDKYLAAICAAPSIFGHKGILKGKKACSNPGFESHLEGAEVIRQPAVTDGHIITSRGMGTAIPFGLAILEQLAGPEAVLEMRKKLEYETGL